MKTLIAALTALTLTVTAASAATICSPIKSTGQYNGEVDFGLAWYFQKLSPMKQEIPDVPEDAHGGKKWTETKSGYDIVYYYRDNTLVTATTGINEKGWLVQAQIAYNCSTFD
jgi:opacity protein-like surface antigen